MAAPDDCAIRPYEPDDLRAAAALWYRAWHDDRPGERHAHPIEWWRARWRDRVVPQAAIHVATVDGAVAGYVAAFHAAPWLSHVVVTLEYRRRGIGTRLLEAAKGASSGGLVFDVFEDDTSARAFYAGCGLTAGETLPHPRSGRPMVRYTWSPPPPVA
jgi:putative acetyltransferase